MLSDCQHGECVALRGDALCFGLWCAGTRAWWWSTAGGLARPLASNPEPRCELNGKAGLLVYATKPMRWMAVKTPSRGGTGVGLGTDGGDGRRRRLGPRCGRGGDGRRAASRAVRRPRRERRLGPRRGGGNLPARGVLAVFSKPVTYPGFAEPSKPRTGSSSMWRHRGEDFNSKKEPRPSDEIM